MSCQIALPESGCYTLVACSFTPGIEATFSLSLFVNAAVDVSVLRGAKTVASPTAAVADGGGKRGKQAAPVAKHDVAKMRAAAADDGTMGYAQRMELEQELRLSKWVENVPMMTVEGQPITENIKKKKDALIAQVDLG